MKLQRWYKRIDPSAFAEVDIISILQQSGYSPIIARTREAIVSSVGGKVEAARSTIKAPVSVKTEGALWENILGSTWTVGSKTKIIWGDWFLDNVVTGVYYIAEMPRDDVFESARVEIGYLGDEVGLVSFEKFRSVVEEATKTLPGTWQRFRLSTKDFVNLRDKQDARLITAEQVRPDELDASRILEDEEIRGLALRIKRSGGILEADLPKTPETQEVAKHTQTLIDSGLLSREFVIICRKTSAQVNRIGAIEKLSELTKLGILCSCGSPIGKERVEALLVPSVLMTRMLDHSYWMSVRLATLLLKSDVVANDILLNVSDGSEEIDALVNVNGSLLIFELKDGEFSMGHAYAFLARLGMNNPQFGIIVSAKSVAPEVKSNFERLKPQAEIIFVEGLKDLEPKLNALLQRLYTKEIADIIDAFSPFTNFELPLRSLISDQIGIEIRQAQLKFRL